MIGIYDYTVILTYLSVASTVTGTFIAFHGYNPIWAVLCLMFSGLCDSFDGKIARTKKKRSAKAASFGIQIDSLADLISYGILPVAIGYSIGMDKWYYLPVAFIFVLAALIRLAHFNVNEEEIKAKGKKKAISFIGLPTTSVCLILPIIYAFRSLSEGFFPVVWAGALLVIAALFVIKLEFVDKPDMKKLIRWIILGIIELTIIIGITLWLTR